MNAIRAQPSQHKADLLRSLRLCTLEGIMAMPLVTMRNIRTLSGVFGLGFLVNYVFYRPQKNDR